MISNKKEKLLNIVTSERPNIPENNDEPLELGLAQQPFEKKRETEPMDGISTPSPLRRRRRPSLKKTDKLASSAEDRLEDPLAVRTGSAHGPGTGEGGDDGVTIEELKLQKLLKEQLLERERLARAKREDELMSNNRDLSEKSRRQEIEVELMKGQLKRRNEQLDEQRESFYKELLILREELFKKNGIPNFAPTDYSTYNWTKKNRYNDDLDHNEDDGSSLDADIGLGGMDTSSYFALREQSKKVQETLNNLKTLEIKRKMELEKLQKEREETAKLKQQLLSQTNEPKEQMVAEVTVPINLPEERPETPPVTLDEEEDEPAVTVSVETNEQQVSTPVTEQQKTEDPVEEKKEMDPITPHPVLYLSSEDEEEIIEPSIEIVSSVRVEKHQTPIPTTPSSRGSRRSLNMSVVDVPLFEERSITPTSSNDEDVASPEIEVDTSEIFKQVDIPQEKQELENVGAQVNEIQQMFKQNQLLMNSLKQRLAVYKHSSKERIERVGPQGEITLVFTDVQDSTRLWELDMYVMSHSIKLHNRLMREILEETEGFEVKTEGDAVSVRSSLF